MAFVPVPNCAEVQLVYSGEAGVYENTLYFDMTAGNAIADLNALAATVKSWWTTNIKPYLSTSVQLDKILATSLAFQSAPGIIYTTGLPSSGSYATTPVLPANVTVAVTFNTVLRGRSFRGRNFWPILCEGQVVNSTVDPTLLTNIHNGYFALIAAATAASKPWVVASRYTGKAPRVAGVITPVVGIGGDGIVDSMRRRLPGRGV